MSEEQPTNLAAETMRADAPSTHSALTRLDELEAERDRAIRQRDHARLIARQAITWLEGERGLRGAHAFLAAFAPLAPGDDDGWRAY